jgi:hypothetical protein
MIRMSLKSKMSLAVSLLAMAVLLLAAFSTRAKSLTKS